MSRSPVFPLEPGHHVRLGYYGVAPHRVVWQVVKTVYARGIVCVHEEPRERGIRRIWWVIIRDRGESFGGPFRLRRSAISFARTVGDHPDYVTRALAGDDRAARVLRRLRRIYAAFETR